MDGTSFKTAEEHAATLQKVWMEMLSKTAQAAFAFTPGSAPPEILREIRQGIFQALAESWEKFMRSPEFLAAMKQWMDQVVAVRKVTSDFMAQVRQEIQAPSREDVDAILLAVRHAEQRLLDRMEQLSAQLEALDGSPSRTKVKRPRTGRGPVPKYQATKTGTSGPAQQHSP